MKVKEKKLYDALNVEVSHFDEPGQKTIKDFIGKEITSVEIFPSSTPAFSSIVISFCKTKHRLYPGSWIVKNPETKKIEVFTERQFEANYQTEN